jgi:Asp-tRNA(Asn)/Glu-tRNA(Gln) amidotransferase A subunit family amidase
MTLFPDDHETIEGVGRDVAAGRRSCAEVLEACLARIDGREGSIRAWVIVDRDGARAQAKVLDDEIRSGRRRGPLHGIPVGIKDIVDVAGLPTAAGSRLWADRVAREDAEVVTRLRAAGAVIVGKTVTTPYACFDPPPTRNPWDGTRTPGGSSSGSAAAVACGMCLGAIGSQTGGSITRPASFCGVCGLKPTYGRLSVRGILPLAPSLDHPGPIARTVGDLALLWQALSGDDLRLGATPVPRLGRLRGLFDERADPTARPVFESALQALAARGCSVVEVGWPEWFNEVLGDHGAIIAAEAAAEHEARLAEHPGDYPPRIRGLIEEGLSLSATRYIRARRHQEDSRRAILACLEGVDALAVPATIGPAPDRSTTGDPAFNSPWSYTGLPIVNFPIGLAPDGLPLGLQLVGRPGGEAALLGIAGTCEGWLRDAASGIEVRRPGPGETR